MKRPISHLVSILLLFILLLGTFPLTAFAAQNSDIVTIATSDNTVKTNDNNIYGPQYAWCAGFVSWCARKANISTDIIPNTYACKTMYNGMLNNGAQLVTSPTVGDLIFYTQDGGKTFAHVGIMISATMSVQGNVGNKVQTIAPTSYRFIDRSSATTANIKYVRPRYNSGNSVYINHLGNGMFHLRNINTTGVGDIGFAYGNPGWIPITGDWNGDGITTIGVFDPIRAMFHLRNSNTTGVGDIGFAYGNPGWIPITGDWNGDGITTIGVYDPVNAMFHLRNSNTTGVGDIGFAYGNPGWIPITGDWNGDGITTIGVFDPVHAMFYLRNSNTTGVGDIGFAYGNPGWIPITGDWNGDGKTTIGVCPTP